MVTERAIINGLILTACFFLVPFVISEFLVVDYLPLYCLGAMFSLVVSFFFLKQNLCVCPLLCGSVVGTLNFLPAQFSVGHVACILLILYYLTGYVLIKQRQIKLGRPMLLWPILLVTLIILYHNHSLKLGSLGGDEEGGRPAILIFIVVVAYFCGINVPPPSVSLLSRIPYYAVVITAVTSIPYLLTTVMPGLAPALYAVTSNVNVESYIDSVNGGGGALSKLSAFAPLSLSLQAYLVSYYPIGTWWRPQRWWVLGLSLLCVIMSACCGYRSQLFDFAFLTLAASWCYYSWRAAFLFVPVVVAVMFVLVASSTHMINLPLNKLPMITQRTLSFLPGDWDPEASNSGNASDEFRKGIIDVYLKEYAGNSPLFGNGFTINTKTFNYYDDLKKTGGGADAHYIEAKLFIEGKMYHTGWISVYDCVGLIGSLGFAALAFNLLRLNYRLMSGPRADRRSSLHPLYVWIFANNATSVASYLTVFGAFSDTFMNLIIYSIVLSQLWDLTKTTEAPLIPGKIEGSGEMPRISGAYYGRR